MIGRAANSSLDRSISRLLVCFAYIFPSSEFNHLPVLFHLQLVSALVPVPLEFLPDTSSEIQAVGGSHPTPFVVELLQRFAPQKLSAVVNGDTQVHVCNKNDREQNSHNDQLTVALIAQLVEHCTGIAVVMGSNRVQA